MLNITKHKDFFNGDEFKDPIHIIGVGAIGSHVAEQLTRLGIPALTIYDLDTVDAPNLANQMYRKQDIGQAKVDAIADQMQAINPDIQIQIFNKGYIRQALSGHVFLCVDNIELRRAIVEANYNNPHIHTMYDFRMRLTDAQHYAANWTEPKQKKNFLASMEFSSEEAKAATPVSACGTTLSVLPTVRTITALGVSNFINNVNKGDLKNLILIDAFTFDITTI